MATRKTPAKKAAAPTPAAPRPAKKPGAPPSQTGNEHYDYVLFVPKGKLTADAKRMIDELGLRPILIAGAKAYVSP